MHAGGKGLKRTSHGGKAIRTVLGEKSRTPSLCPVIRCEFNLIARISRVRLRQRGGCLRLASVSQSQWGRMPTRIGRGMVPVASGWGACRGCEHHAPLSLLLFTMASRRDGQPGSILGDRQPGSILGSKLVGGTVIVQENFDALW